VMSKAEQDGSTCLPVPELATRAGELLGAPPGAVLFSEMADAGALVNEIGVDEPVWAYRPATAKARARPRPDCRRARRRAGEPEGRGAPASDDLVPAPEQAAAVRAAFGFRLSTVTGGPGTGKTTTIF
jgi:exodeoxyribonuclease V alpha subunit